MQNNNPNPRRSSLLSSFVAKPTTPTEIAASIKTSAIPNVDSKANQMVGAILKKGSMPSQEPTPVAKLASNEQASTDSSNEFRLPPEESCGLWNPDIILDASQLEAVNELKKHQYGCLIGAAGTGKTTVQKYLLKELIYNDSTFQLKNLVGKQGVNIAMVAFTGMAVQVMKSNLPTWMHRSCKTIHSLLEFSPEQVLNKAGKETRIFMPSRNSMCKLEHDIIIIDEASMLGLDLWIQLISACRIGTRIFMTGDLNQLPPIIGQPIFGYTLGGWPVCALTKIHRQKEVGANRIIEIAHQVLNGKMPTFDESKNNPDWRVLYSELDMDPTKAHRQILSVLNQLRKTPVDRLDPDSPMVYNPHRDRVMTAGNGFDTDVNSAMVQQAPLNEALALMIQPASEENPRYVIDGGRVTQRFSRNLRVMATKNESPAEEQRVTNGMAGFIEDIEPNPRFTGDRTKFGPEEYVLAESRKSLALMRGGVASDESFSKEDLSMIDLGVDYQPVCMINEDEEKGGGASSHIITVVFDNGAFRKFSSKAQVESLQLAFCSTVAKCQGSQFDTVIIICHSIVKNQLSREWLYTGITRAAKRVIILGTKYGLTCAVNRQRIKGHTLAEKIERYRALSNEGLKSEGMRMKMNVPIRIEDYTGDPIKVDFKFALNEESV